MKLYKQFKYRNKLYIPFSSGSEAVGGPHTFLFNLKNYLDKVGFRYLLENNGKSSIFFPIEYDMKSLQVIKDNGGKIIQRLDGIYYPSKHGEKYIELNKVIKDIYLNYADFIVFQSEYSRKQCFEMFGPQPEKKYSIVVNGVDPTIFFPDKKMAQSKDKFTFITTGNFRNKDMIVPMVNALDKLVEEQTIKQAIDLTAKMVTDFHFELKIVGPIADPKLMAFLDRKYIHHIDKVSIADVAIMLRQSDAFIYSHLNPPCPNSVLEAIATGLPVVGFDSGSMKELLYFNADLLAEVTDEIFQKYEDLSSSNLYNCLRILLADYEKYKIRSLSHANNYNFNICGEKYLDVFKRVLS